VRFLQFFFDFIVLQYGMWDLAEPWCRQRRRLHSSGLSECGVRLAPSLLPLLLLLLSLLLLLLLLLSHVLGKVTKLGRSFARSRDYDAMGGCGCITRHSQRLGLAGGQQPCGSGWAQLWAT